MRPRPIVRTYLLVLVTLLPFRSPEARAGWVCVPSSEGGWRCGTGAPQTGAVPTQATAIIQPPRGTAADPGRRPTTARDPARAMACAPARRLARPGAGSPRDRAEAPIEIEATRSELREGRIAVFEGGVTLERADQRLESERVRYDRASGVVEAEGTVRYGEPGLGLAAERARLSLPDDRGRFEQVRFEIPARSGRGHAALALVAGRTQARFERVRYTTCPPEREVWSLAARRLDLDRERGEGRARHVVLRAGRLPVLYSPYLSFPIDDRRKTGFLTPGFGRSDRTGTDVRLPWYWNIAPNYDLTLVPRWLGRRGAQLGVELRYLTRRSRGEVQAEYLPGDDVRGRDRGLARLHHRTTMGAWRLTVDARAVTDEHYFEDLGSSLAVASATHLEQRADLDWSRGRWSARVRAQAFQTIDPAIAKTAYPYRRLPQLRLALAPGKDAFGTSWSGWLELVRFDHPAAGKTRGLRLDLRPRVSWPVRRPGWFVVPALALRHTRYRLEDPAPGTPRTLTRTLPTASLDAGLYLERAFRAGRGTYVHTLEPRLFYLRVPYEDQSALPVFDTGLLDFSLAQLFREDRFSGPDRVGDADQLTLALTTRLIESETARELLSLTLGQIRYFRDRRVTLPGAAPETAGRSNLIAVLSAAPGTRLRLSGGVQWDPNRAGLDRAGLDLRYRVDPGRLAALAYRFRRGTLEQVDLAARWRLGRRWHLVGRWNRSLREDLDLERFAGLEYDACCWAARLVLREYLTNASGTPNRSVLLQVELKGLASVGDRVDRFLERGILGYAQAPGG